MGKFIKKIISIFIVLTFVCPSAVFASDVTEKTLIPEDVKLVLSIGSKIGIFDREMDVIENVPYEEEGVFMIPVSYLAEKMGYEVTPGENEYLLEGDKKITITNESNIIVADGENTELKSNSVITEDECYVAQDFVTVLGYNYTVESDVLIMTKEGDSQVNVNLLKQMQGIYVSPDVEKNGSGSPESPLKDLKEIKSLASEYIKAFGKEYPVYIFCHGGRYEFDETIDLSGTEFATDGVQGLKFESFGDGEVVFTGAKEIDANDLLPVTDAKTLARIPKNGRGKVAYLDLTTQGISGLSVNDVSFPYIYVNDVEMQQSRWPNFDFTTCAGVADSTTFNYSESNPSRWTTATDAYVNGYFTADYNYEFAKIVSVDPSAMAIKLNKSGFQTSRVGARWYARNLLEEIDIPGEWFVDRQTNILYFYPPYSMKDVKFEIVTFHDDPMFRIGSAKNIGFKDITFTKTGGYVMEGNSSDGLTVQNCNFSYVQGAYCIYFGGSNFNFLIEENEAYGCGGGFVFCWAGNPNYLTPSNCVYQNNHVTGCGFNYPSSIIAAFYAGWNNNARNCSIGVTIKNNVIQDCGTTYAISYPGNEVKILNNEICNVAYNVKDGGVIYVGRARTAYGFEVAYNFIHHLNKDNYMCALYNDDSYAGASWHHNVIYEAQRSTIFGLGADSVFNYNLAINCVYPGNLGSRFTWYTNNSEPIDEVKRVINEYDKSFVETYPQLLEIVNKDPFNAPWNSLFYGNVGVNTGGSTLSGALAEIAEYGYDLKDENGNDLNATPLGNPHYEYSDDYFVDASKMDFTLKEDSVIVQDVPEMANIKMDEIGIMSDADNLNQVPERFRLRSPTNGNRSVQTKEIVFSWDPVKNATKYRLMVATDKDFQNMIIDQTIVAQGNDNKIAVNTLELDTVYYWKVQAIGLARQNQFVVESFGGPYVFKTAQKNELEKDNLKLAIESGEAFKEEITAENSEYKYDETFVADFIKTMDEANSILKYSASQEEVDAIEEEIYLLIKQSPMFMVIEYENVPGIYDDTSKWEITGTGNGVITKNSDGSITFSSDNTRLDASIDVPQTNKVYSFYLKLDTVGDGGSYQGIDIKYDDDGKGYLVVVKESIFEYQRINQTLNELPNDLVKPNEWYLVETGAVNTPTGVLQFLRIDGQTLYAMLDQSSSQVRTGGHFRLRKNAEGSMHLKPVPESELSQPGILYNDILQEFNNPQNVAHLACLLDGSAALLELTSTFYSMVNKQDMASIMYDEVKNKTVQISEDGDVSAYKDRAMSAAVLAAYNGGLSDYIYRNNIEILYPEYLELEKIDQNGVNLYNFYKTQFAVKDCNAVLSTLTNNGYKSYDDLRKYFAKSVFTVAMNIYSSTFAATSTYMYDILTEENMAYLGADISEYFKLTDEQKGRLHDIIGRSGTGERAFDEIISEINATVSQVK